MSSFLLSVHSECRVWSSSVAPVLPSGLSSVPKSQLCSSPGRSGGRPDAWCGCSAELWAAAPGAVPVLDIFLCLHLVCALRCFLEHFCLQPAWCATAPTTMSCLLEAQKTLYPFYSSLGRRLTARLDESPGPSLTEPHLEVVRVVWQPLRSYIQCSDAMILGMQQPSVLHLTFLDTCATFSG